MFSVISKFLKVEFMVFNKEIYVAGTVAVLGTAGPGAEIICGALV